MEAIEDSPACVVDRGFGGFNCPALYYRHWRPGAPTKQIHGDDSGFAFYSAWRYLIATWIAGA